MGLDIDLDLTDTSSDDADRSSRARPGWHLCRVKEVKELESPHGVLLFTFEIAAGPYRGCLLFDRLYPVNYDNDDKKRKTRKSRMAMYLKRLGIVSDDAFGKRVTGTWADAIGRECVLDTEGDHYTDGEGVQKESVKVKFDGIYRVTDPRIPNEVRERLKLPPADDGNGPGLFDGAKPNRPTKPPAKGPSKQDYNDYL